MSDLPRYRSHKIVQAARIVEIKWCQAPNRGGRLEFGPGLEAVDVSGAYVEKHQPTVGGYYIRYEDGYESFSPAHAFEGGYTRITEEQS